MKLPLIFVAAIVFEASSVAADGNHALHQQRANLSPADADKVADLDILAAQAQGSGNTVCFHMTTSGTVGASVPTATGAVGGSTVWFYVWPTSLDPSARGL